jgi:dihydroorotate dehydrogenase
MAALRVRNVFARDALAEFVADAAGVGGQADATGVERGAAGGQADATGVERGAAGGQADAMGVDPAIAGRQIGAAGSHAGAVPGGEASMGVQLMGLRFPNRVGLAAGFDKNAYDVDSLGRLGFGFIEVGTVTPRPQPGNPRPNLFRLVPDEALINRLGFNNEGAAAVVRRLEARRYAGICGVNIGKNFDTPLDSSVNDYASCLRTVYSVADYVTINVSSPNTPGLRGLQDPGALRPLLLELADLREQLVTVHSKRVPLLVKLSPDLNDEQVLDVARELRELPVDGIVATNTTTTRPGPLKSAAAVETGGLSGRPLHSRSVAMLRSLRAAMGPGFPIIGVGGIVSPEAAMATRHAGADLLQLYTGLIYRGPALIRELLDIVRSSSHEHP